MENSILKCSSFYGVHHIPDSNSGINDLLCSILDDYIINKYAI